MSDLIDKTFSSLTQEEQSILLDGFNSMKEVFVVKDDIFLGAHCANNPNLIVDIVSGFWSMGRVKR